MIPYFKAYLIKHEKIVDVREINYNLLEIGWRDDDFHDTVSSFDDIKFIQSTGLFDKNGKEIYEGDILRGPMDFGPAGWIESVGIVSYHEIYGYQLNYFLLEHTEIIGNKFEHPHLLGEE